MTKNQKKKKNTAALHHGPKSDVGPVFLFFTPGSSQKEIILLKDVASKLWNFLSLD